MSPHGPSHAPQGEAVRVHCRGGASDGTEGGRPLAGLASCRRRNTNRRVLGDAGTAESVDRSFERMNAGPPRSWACPRLPDYTTRGGLRRQPTRVDLPLTRWRVSVDRAMGLPVVRENTVARTGARARPGSPGTCAKHNCVGSDTGRGSSASRNRLEPTPAGKVASASGRIRWIGRQGGTTISPGVLVWVQIGDNKSRRFLAGGTMPWSTGIAGPCTAPGMPGVSGISPPPACPGAGATTTPGEARHETDDDWPLRRPIDHDSPFDRRGVAGCGTGQTVVEEARNRLAAQLARGQQQRRPQRPLRIHSEGGAVRRVQRHNGRR